MIKIFRIILILAAMLTGLCAQSLAADTGQPTAATTTSGQVSPPQTEEEASLLEIPIEKQQMINVKTVTAVVQPMKTVIRTTGRVTYDERRLSVITTRFEGWIENLNVAVTGSYIHKGQPLAEIYSPELYATELEFLNALRQPRPSVGDKTDGLQALLARDTQSLVEGARQRLRLLGVADAQIDQLEKTGKARRPLSVDSPVTGVVIDKLAVKGMRVMPGDKLFAIADLSTVWLVGDLYESQMPMVHTGDGATISLDNSPDKGFMATIEFISPTLSNTTRTVTIRSSVSNTDGRLKPGMFATLAIAADQGDRLAVPDDSVIDTGTRKIVYVDKGEGIFEPREVTTGLKTGGLTEILEGVAPGEKVAAAANFLIDSESQLKGIAPTPLH